MLYDLILAVGGLALINLSVYMFSQIPDEYYTDFKILEGVLGFIFFVIGVYIYYKGLGLIN